MIANRLARKTTRRVNVEEGLVQTLLLSLLLQHCPAPFPAGYFLNAFSPGSVAAWSLDLQERGNPELSSGRSSKPGISGPDPIYFQRQAFKYIQRQAHNFHYTNEATAFSLKCANSRRGGILAALYCESKCDLTWQPPRSGGNPASPAEFQ